ncbi:hypothetical protein BHE74_00035468 [Ensete ventricosum]|nr:hypothetical protein BHE74_00035468 [Ensete ventricosum]RZS12969.1 hypothetical protein BHM03_00044482 [Ensete ventricosum]
MSSEEPKGEEESKDGRASKRGGVGVPERTRGHKSSDVVRSLLLHSPAPPVCLKPRLRRSFYSSTSLFSFSFLLNKHK